MELMTPTAVPKALAIGVAPGIRRRGPELPRSGAEPAKLPRSAGTPARALAGFARD